jgi:hypothetical protein
MCVKVYSNTRQIFCINFIMQCCQSRAIHEGDGVMKNVTHGGGGGVSKEVQKLNKYYLNAFDIQCALIVF